MPARTVPSQTTKRAAELLVGALRHNHKTTEQLVASITHPGGDAAELKKLLVGINGVRDTLLKAMESGKSGDAEMAAPLLFTSLEYYEARTYYKEQPLASGPKDMGYMLRSTGYTMYDLAAIYPPEDVHKMQVDRWNFMQEQTLLSETFGMELVEWR